MQTANIPLYIETMPYTNWIMETKKLDGIHVFPEITSLVVNNCYYAIARLPNEWISGKVELVEGKVASFNGISEDTLLAALAIAQDPSQAVQLLALRQTSKI